IPNGNGQVEQCDDGNLNNTDSCSNSCTLQICGNGVVDNGELCDDGNENNNDACSNQCLPTICGDGIVQDPNSNGQAEQCDDGNTNNNDQCDNECNVCVDEDNDGVCIDQCPDSKPGEPVDENGCDNFQFCNQKGLSCGLECFHADFRNNEPDTEFPHDCTVVVPLKNGIESQPICVPTVSSDLCSN
ncbi:MAG: DUF4215 domain-containing protein, partial [Nitrosarchaeum sp.]|nr:DUF4215 domain-containing protein [Nitrosarchaeum sp.]